MKNILGTFKLILPAGNLTTSIIGSYLGQYGINLINFCKEFNEKTKINKGTKIRVKIIIFENKKYLIYSYSLPTSYLILNLLNILKGSSKPTKNIIGKLKQQDILKIIKIKKLDLYPISIKSLFKMIKGTAKSMGILYSKT